MSDFGEPWRMETHEDGHNELVDRKGLPVPESLRQLRRARICTTALAGIADPAAFVERAKAMERLLEHMNSTWLLAFNRLPDAEIAALAAEWTPDD